MTDENEITALKDQVAELTARLAAAEQRMVEFDRMAVRWAEEHQVDEDTLMVIAAAVAAVLGHRARVKQIQFHEGSGWTAAGRMEVQDHRKTQARPARQAPLTLH
ncbi:hypothetical protein [Raineyella sp. W15-4]|uniref:hypothetical protein n=1 Tax=Raineyella sp. W15-4 TaxID=3081651 RepID=UPI002955CBA8|nr:hypothetical protein [Raineyella sp. W15-4]WOQ16237.1 hypothetical protein R0145_13635 [Raineyella sp. W15-4]